MNRVLRTHIRLWRCILWLLFLGAVVLLYPGGLRHGFAEEIQPRLVLDEYRVYRHDLAFSADGKLLAVTDGHRPVRLWDVASGEERLALKTRGSGDRVCRVLLSPDGKTVALGSEDGFIRLVDAVSKAEIATFGGGFNSSGHVAMAFAPDGRTFVVAPVQPGTKEDERQVIVWDPVRRTIRATFMTQRLTEPYCMVFAPDGKTLAVSTVSSKDIFLRDVQSGETIGTLKAENREGHDCELAFSADGATLATASTEAIVKLWDVKTRSARAILQKRGITTPRRICIAFSPDGRTVISMARTGLLRLWETATGELRMHDDELKASGSTFAFNPDGHTIAVLDWNGSITFWDILRIKAKPPVPVVLTQLWADLENQDAVRAYRAIRTLVAYPMQSLPYLSARLQPATPLPDPPARKIERWLANLGSDDFDTRQKAGEALERCGELAVPALRRALSEKITLDFRKRVEDILKNIDQEKTAKQLQGIRAVEVLEHIGAPEARKLLEELAKGAPEARLTREAKASLARLAKRPAPKP